MNTRYSQARRSIQTLTKTNPNSDRKLSSRSRGAAEEDEARGPVKAGRSDPRNVDEPVASKPWASGNRRSSPARRAGLMAVSLQVLTASRFPGPYPPDVQAPRFPEVVWVLLVSL